MATAMNALGGTCGYYGYDQWNQGTIGSYGSYTIGNQTTQMATQYVTFGQYATTVATNYYQTYQTQFTIGSTNVIYGSAVPETAEQRIEREQRERDQKAKNEARSKRAKETLLLTLNKKQQEQFEKEEHFELQVNGRLYRVRPGRRVERLDPTSKKVESFFCIHPALEHDLPPEDVAISQKLWLEANETEFLRVANETKAA